MLNLKDILLNEQEQAYIKSICTLYNITTIEYIVRAVKRQLDIDYKKIEDTYNG